MMAADHHVVIASGEDRLNEAELAAASQHIEFAVADLARLEGSGRSSRMGTWTMWRSAWAAVCAMLALRGGGQEKRTLTLLGSASSFGWLLGKLYEAAGPRRVISVAASHAYNQAVSPKTHQGRRVRRVLARRPAGGSDMFRRIPIAYVVLLVLFALSALAVVLFTIPPNELPGVTEWQPTPPPRESPRPGLWLP
jgi:hypothetical protein